MKIDYSKFKKIDSDDKSTTLLHPSGHQIIIAHKGLSQDHKKELDDMPIHQAKGGFSKYSQKFDPNIKKKMYTRPPGKGIGPEASGLSKASSPSQPERDPAYTEPKDIGSQQPAPTGKYGLPVLPKKPVSEWNVKEPQTSPMYPPCINPSCKSYGRSHPNCRCYGGNEYAYEKMAEGGEVKGFCSHGARVHEKGCEYFKDGGMSGKESDSDKLEQAAQDVNANLQSTEPQQEETESASSPNEQPEINVAESRQPDAAQTNPDEDQAASEPQQDQSVLPEQDQESRPQTPIEQAQAIKNNYSNMMLKESNDIQQDLANGHIDPKTYHDLMWKDKGVLGKLGTIFGMMMSSMGAGLSHQPNMYMQMMDNEIARDLDAQKAEVSKKQNLLNYNAHIVRGGPFMGMNAADATTAYNMARMQKNVAFSDYLNRQFQKLPEGSPQKQQMSNALVLLSQKMNDQNSSLAAQAGAAQALSNAMFGGSGQGNGINTTMAKTGFGGPGLQEMGQDIESKSIPGIPGKASYPLSSGDKDEIGSGMQFDRQLTNFMNWAKNHSGDLSPSDRKYGQTLAAQVQGAYRQATHGGVYKEGEQNFISKIISDNPTAFFNKIRVLPQLQAVKDDLNMRMDQSLKNKGFKGYPGIKTSSSQQQTKTMNGKQYKKVQGGWMPI